MLAELNALTPRGGREKMDRQLVRGTIGLKHRLGMGVHWSSQLADELHNPVRKHYQKRSVFAKQVDDIWTADLVDMSPYSRSNSCYKYLLTVIDAFSKYGWIAMAFQELFTDNAPPSRLWTDNGAELYNQHVKRVLAANNVTLYSTENEEKSTVVERWNRTMKNIIWKYFTANNTQKYIDVLRGMVEKYNSKYHRLIKLKPADARKPADYKHIHNALYAKVNVRKATPPRFRVGDTVRILRKKGSFENGFTPNWSEVFTNTTVKATKPPTYTIEDTRGDPGNLLRAGDADKCAGNLAYRTIAQEGKRPSVGQVGRLQQCIQFVDTTSRR